MGMFSTSLAGLLGTLGDLLGYPFAEANKLTIYMLTNI